MATEDQQPTAVEATGSGGGKGGGGGAIVGGGAGGAGGVGDGSGAGGALPALPVLIASLVTEVRGLRTDVRDALRAYRRLRVVQVVVVIALIFGGYSVYGNRHAQQVACERDNKLRAANLQLWRPLLLAAPVPVLPDNPTPEQQARYDAEVKQRTTFQKALESGFELHNC